MESIKREKPNSNKGKDKDQVLIQRVNAWNGTDLVELKKILKKIVRAD
jgi:hypothetical protein